MERGPTFSELAAGEALHRREVASLRDEMAGMRTELREQKAENERLRAALQIARDWMPVNPIEPEGKAACKIVDNALALEQSTPADTAWHCNRCKQSYTPKDRDYRCPHCLR